MGGSGQAAEQEKENRTVVEEISTLLTSLRKSLRKANEARSSSDGERKICAACDEASASAQPGQVKLDAAWTDTIIERLDNSLEAS